jgi:hypothetical protein
MRIRNPDYMELLEKINSQTIWGQMAWLALRSDNKISNVADPDPTFHLDADPDPAFQSDKSEITGLQTLPQSSILSIHTRVQ